jgi:phage terminase large subunit-like protein
VSGSLAASLASRPATEREAVLAELSPQELEALEYDWPFWARPAQLPPEGDWTVWLRMAGRGEGKTRSGAEWCRMQAETMPGSIGHLVAPTAADARDVMVDGPSGLCTISPPWARPEYEPSKRRLTWPNGTVALLFSADEPERLRGPQCHWAWTDELAAWRYPAAWDQLLMGLRLGERPQVVVTTTPRPTKVIRDLLTRPDCVVSRGRTADNIANLAPAFLTQVVHRYQGTRLGRQELEGELLEDVPGALWTRALLDETRVGAAPPMSRVVVGVDPAVTSGEEADETGIVVCGIDSQRHGYVLEDGSGRYPPLGWARKVVSLYEAHRADRVVAEINNGGEMVEATLRMIAPGLPVTTVHATRGKHKRAEPVAALWERGVGHLVGVHATLEDQCATWEPTTTDWSPDRMDALVWAMTDLCVDAEPSPRVAVLDWS